MFGMGLGGVLFAVVALVIWLLILVWLSERILHFVGLRTGWRPLDPRNLGASAVLLGGAIHFGNYAIDWIEALARDVAGPALPIPSAFLIGSVAIGVGVAGVRWHRKQKKK